MAMTYYGASYEPWYNRQSCLSPSYYASQRSYYQRPSWPGYRREYMRVISAVL